MASRKPYKPPYDILEVVWWDHSNYADIAWRDTAFLVEDLKPYQAATVGYLLADYPTHIILSSTLTPPQDEGDTESSRLEMLILKSNIIKKKNLR